MDMLKRHLSPVSDVAWDLLDQQARKSLSAHLSARRVVDVSGPHGWDHASVAVGRLNVPEGQKKDEVQYGVHLVQPLVEARVSFDLDLWELDNLVRGAQDVNLEPLEGAARKIARFEEKALYEGFDPGCILGMAQAGEAQTLDLPLGKAKDLLLGLNRGVRLLEGEAIEGPYALVGGEKLHDALEAQSEGYPLRKRIERLVGDKVVFSPFFDGALLVSLRGGDLELVLGQDLSLGFESAKEGKVRLFFAESFTFRVHEPRAVVSFRLK